MDQDYRPVRPHSLQFDPEPPSKSVTPSPASEAEHVHFPEGALDEKEVCDFLKDIDEILDYMKPFPRTTIKPERMEEVASRGATPTNRVDHLENLIRLVEQLKELKEKNYESREKFKDLKKHGKKSKYVYAYDVPPPPPDPQPGKRSSISFRRGSRTKSLTAQELFPKSSHRQSLSLGKAKISKWTKVKEAFRWEKAGLLEGKPRKPEKRDLSEEEVHAPGSSNQSNLLKVPERPPGPPSPADSVLSGHVSIGSSSGATSSSCLLTTSGYSGEPSLGTLSHSSVCLGDWAHPPDSHVPFSYPHAQSLQELSSSSGDERADEKSPDRRDLATARLGEESDARRSKSLDGETILGPSTYLFNEFNDESKSKHKTPWEKVIDIIQTRKDSLKKKPARKEDDGAMGISVDSTSADILALEGALAMSMVPKIELTSEPQPQPAPQHILMRRLQNSTTRPLTPVLTITTPSTEELRNLSSGQPSDAQSSFVKDCDSSLQNSVVTSAAPPPAHIPSSSAVPIPDRDSRWIRVKKAFLTSTSPEMAPGFSSAPSSPLHLGAFFSDHDSADEMSSGDWNETKKEIFQYPAFTEDVPKSSLEIEPIERRVTISKFPPELPKSDDISRKPRESLSIPLPTVNDLSPEFKKKLDEWKKIKKNPTTPPPSKDEGHFISRIGEWQRWRPGSSTKTESHHAKHEHHLQDEFYKRLEEWQMLKGSKRSRSQSDKGKTDRDNQTPSPGISRKNSKRKKVTSGKSSGSDSHGGSIKEKDGRSGRKTQKEKDLQWLEKELQKIEREKIRLEREKEKYLEREARLEQMKRTMGTTTPTQEVLIQTATGFFRFEGISQKFALKLYEWEKSRGIAPEASTLALLEKASVPCRMRDERPLLQRSKSVGSVIDTSSAAALSAAHHPSSLSLNDVDDFEAMEHASILADAVRMSEEFNNKEEDEPEAIIVDVEDIEEETADILEQEPQVSVQVPVYSYAPAEVTQLIDSSGSDSERELHVCRTVLQNLVEPTTDVTLIDENITLLNKLERNESIRRKIEKDLDVIGGKFAEGTSFSEENHSKLMQEGENLQHSFMDHSVKQKEIVHSLVDKMRILHEATSDDTKGNVKVIIDITSQLLELAGKLEAELNQRNADIQPRRREKGRMNRLGADKMWFSIEEENSSGSTPPIRPDVDIGDLSSMITKKVVELKTGLQQLRQASVDIGESSSKCDAEQPVDEPDNCASFTFRAPKQAPVEATLEKAPTPQKSPSRRKKVSSDIGKSKAQNICGANAEEIFERNLKVAQENKEQKSPEVLKKRIKENIQKMQRLATEPRTKPGESPPVDDSKIFNVDQEAIEKAHKKNLKARRITDTSIAYQAKNIEPNYGELEEMSGTTPNIVFVPTSRKIISPVQTDPSSSVLSYVIDDIEPPADAVTSVCLSQDDPIPKPIGDIGTPPVASSPVSIRKFETGNASPSIRMMIAKYNKKISDAQENEETRAAWRSPVLDRKIREQMSKYGDDGASILKHGGKFGRGEILKSASTGILRNDAINSDVENRSGPSRSEKGILKSSSTGTVKSGSSVCSVIDPPNQPGTSLPAEASAVYPLPLRALRLRQAKAEFLAKGPGSHSYSGSTDLPKKLDCSLFSRAKVDSTENNSRNRLSQVSVDSDTSFERGSYSEDLPLLIKSASAGMLNLHRQPVEERFVQKTVSTSAVPGAGADSPVKPKKFGIFNIKSKFRKVKMRRAKEKESAVHTLVRQSLVLGVSSRPSTSSTPPEANINATAPSCSRSCPASPVLDRPRPDKGKWGLSRSKLFQPKDKKTRLSTESSSDVT